MSDDQRAAALEKWTADGATIRALVAPWRARGGGVDVSVAVIDSTEADGSLVRRIAVRDPQPRYIHLVYTLRPDNRFQAHWGVGLGNADFMSFTPEKYAASIAAHLSMIFGNRGWPAPPERG